MLCPINSPRIEEHDQTLAGDNLAAAPLHKKRHGPGRVVACAFMLAGLVFWSASSFERPQAVLQPRLPRMIAPPVSAWGIALRTLQPQRNPNSRFTAQPFLILIVPAGVTGDKSKSAN